jgi:hypothetical protein
MLPAQACKACEAAALCPQLSEDLPNESGFRPVVGPTKPSAPSQQATTSAENFDLLSSLVVFFDAVRRIFLRFV